MPLLIITVFLIVSVVYYFISTQRELVYLDEKVKNALSQISVQIETRWDAITSLAKMVEKYSKHEHDSLMNIIEQRRADKIDTSEDALQQQKATGQVLSQINAVAEQYPELRASVLFESTLEQINEFENNVRRSRQSYNDTATQMNSLIRQWPSAFVAKRLKFEPVKYLQFGNDKNAMPNV